MTSRIVDTLRASRLPISTHGALPLSPFYHAHTCFPPKQRWRRIGVGSASATARGGREWRAASSLDFKPARRQWQRILRLATWRRGGGGSSVAASRGLSPYVFARRYRSIRAQRWRLAA